VTLSFERGPRSKVRAPRPAGVTAADQGPRRARRATPITPFGPRPAQRAAYIHGSIKSSGPNFIGPQVDHKYPIPLCTYDRRTTFPAKIMRQIFSFGPYLPRCVVRVSMVSFRVCGPLCSSYATSTALTVRSLTPRLTLVKSRAGLRLIMCLKPTSYPKAWWS
jgi:hypothetical protein